MSQPAILALDQGTTGSTALVVAEDGRILGRSYSEFTQHYPRPGWVEHDAREIWEVTARVAREAMQSSPEARDARLEGVGITNQRETLVVWDRDTLEPVHRAIVWQDRRTTPICRALKAAGHEDRVRDVTGLVLDPYFTGTKLTWLLREKPEIRRRAEAGELAAGTVDSWLVARLTAGRSHLTDATNASRTLLYDIRKGTWSPELLGLLEVPAAVLPEVRASSGDFGVASGAFLGRELPILGVAGDQQAALFGQGCWGPGLAKNTYGTGAFLLLHTGDQPVLSRAGLLTTVACDARGAPAYALEGAIFIAGAALQWLRDELRILDSSSDSEELARALSGNEGVYFVPAFVGMGAPHWEPEARGMLVGLTRGTGRAHLARAALEAMAYQTADVLEAMERDSGIELAELRVDGGAAANDWLMRFQAGLLGVPVRRPALVETTAFGAAGLAGLAAGIWPSAEAFLQARESPTVFGPEMSQGEREGLQAGWRRAVSTALHWTRWEAGAPAG
ncbi:MAG TPA: glycerol kinase GlpK [Longimicrobiales bacterium]|nr:glycerol kinase GlpK [Longimicrobiales bacterium]